MDCCATKLSRRRALQGIGCGIAALGTVGARPIVAGPFPANGEQVPIDKKLDRDWLQALTQRGVPTSYTTWSEQRYIGMPLSGIGTGTVYIGGDGKLWCWDIFNQAHEGVVPSKVSPSAYTNLRGGRLRERDGANFVDPPLQQDSPWHFEQGFAVVIQGEDRESRLPLSSDGFPDIRFTASAPTARVRYRSAESPIQVDLEAMTPFIPLDADSSSFPAALLRYRVTNKSASECRGSIEGWFENPVLRYHAHRNDVPLENRVFRGECGVGVIGSAARSTLDSTRALPTIEDQADFGSFALYCTDHDAVADTHAFFQRSKDAAAHTEAFQSHPWSPAIAGVSAAFALGPGQQKEFEFVVSWHFPNLRLQTKTWSDEPKVFPLANSRRRYACRFSDAAAVAEELVEDKAHLLESTSRWRDTWYDSTLPYWLLERCFNSANALQTNTCVQFEDGRFWGWEGVGCCPGTCTHVWHYAQSIARLFPSLERNLRTQTDFGVAFREDGAIRYRAEFENSDAIDGQAGVILRTYREHLMSANSEFLGNVWPRARKSIEYLIAMDARGATPDGMPSGPQPNTLDATWHGKVPAHVSLYIAALRAGGRMARFMDDPGFANRCQSIADRGASNVVDLFDPDFGYFVQELDPAHRDEIGVGDGCHIDQVIGQWWAFQLGLGRIYDGELIRRALTSIWNYNFCPDVGRFQVSIENPRHRGNPYALAGDAGVLTCTWPHSQPRRAWQDHWQFAYFNTCFQGLEYQVAGHMIWESDTQPDLLEKGLAVTRAVHDRYHGSLRNPYNEIECSDHYARAMSAYGIFLAVCGFEIDGPQQHIGFKPRLTNAGRFKSAFTAPNGWGSFEQAPIDSGFLFRLSLQYGLLDLRSIGLRPSTEISDHDMQTPFGWARIKSDQGDVVVTFRKPVRLTAGQTLELHLRPVTGQS